VLVEIEWTAGTWTNVTSYVSAEAGMRGAFGRATQFDDTSAGTWTLTLRNTDGRFTPDNPTSPYFPNVVKSKRLRVTVVKGSSYPRFTGYITSIVPSFPSGDGSDGVVVITAADLISVLARRTTETGYVEQAAYVAQFAAGWNDLFAFGGPSAASYFENRGIPRGTGTPGTATIIPARTGAGAWQISEPEGLLVDGQLDLEPSGVVGPVLKVVPSGPFTQLEFFLKIPTTVEIPSGGVAVTVLDVWADYGPFFSLRVFHDVGTGQDALGFYNAAGDFAQVIPESRGLNDGQWRKITLYQINPSTTYVNVNDGSTTVYIGAGAIGDATKLYFGASVNPRYEGKPSVAAPCSIAGIDLQSAQTGVFGYFALGQPPTTTALQRYRELMGYASTAAGVRYVPSVTLTSGSATVTSAAPQFTTADVGKGVLVSGFAGTIGAYVSSTQVTLTANSTVSITGTVILGGKIVGSDVRNVVRVNTAETGNLAEALANLARTIGGVFWISTDGTPTLIMPDALRLKTPLTSVNVEDDAQADSIVLEQAVDTAPTRVTVTSPIGDVVVVDSAAEAVAGARQDVTVATGAASIAAAEAIAGYYLSASRALRVKNLTVELASAKNDLYAALLGGLAPGARLRLTGLPSAVFGVTYQDVYVQSWEEEYDHETASITLDCTPAEPVEALFDDAELGRFAATAGAMTVTGGTAVGTTSTGTLVVTTTGGAPVLSTAAGSYPIDLDWNGERVTVTSAPASGTSPQTLTITARGVAPSVARVHTSGERLGVWTEAAFAF
jgi:hypothetical protein